jgi:protein tyrosine phosphatase (PTP) superfamily phosphohydrolase (DUF442 family)/cytochrome c556
MQRIVATLALMLWTSHLAAGQTTNPANPQVPSAPQKVPAPHLPNAYRLHERVISGGLPEGDAAFQELQDLGVKTVISVDGAQPDVKTAAKHGLRYVHLPHGYDGISAERAAELAKAVRDLPGPVYIHCHHGKHRSPAASVVACVSTGLLEPEAAMVVLKTAGTSENYRGLYESALSARRIDDASLDALKVEFPESAKLPAIAEAMIPIEHAHDHLKAFAAANWKKLADKPDLDAPHEALLLREHFTEMLRMPDVEQQPAEFRRLVTDSEAAAKSLEADLRADRHAEAGKALDLVTQKCTACHRGFRDVPLSEKQGTK